MKIQHSLLLIPAIILLLITDLFAQRQYETWYFGANAGISFAGGTPTPLLDGRVNTIDGSAVISRPATGELLFYSDGATVWDSNHVVMQNGTGLDGHPSSGQPALIVPNPGDTNLFYLFTTGAANTATTATRYSIIDMRANGGLGAVTEKNRLLLNNGTEKITATRHCNGKDYWVIAHDWGGSNFYAYLITASGISDTVISDIGEVYATAAQIQGTFQMSPHGRLLAVSSPALQTLEVFDFDNSTGEITNQRLLGKGNAEYYGLEFSPSASRLYVNTLPAGNDPTALYQFDMEAGDLTAIQASRFEYVRLMERGWQGGQLQLGMDGKIYISWTGRDSLGVIEQPDLPAGAAQYRHSGFWLGGRRANYGLPNIIDSDLGSIIPPATSVTTSVQMRPAAAYPGDVVRLVVVACNEGPNPLLNVQLDLKLDPALIPVATGSGQYTLSQVPATGCDSFEIAVRIPDDAPVGDTYVSCVDFLDADPSPCGRPSTSCGDLRVLAPSVDTSDVDYTFHYLPGCPGTTEPVQVMFNSRRFTDTITGVAFTGAQAHQFSYGGSTPVRIPITPTTDQLIPITVRRVAPGPISTIMILSTVNQDTFRVRLLSDVKPSTTPFLDISEIRTGGRTGSFDTCLTVTNVETQAVVVVDTVWLRSGSQASRLSPEIPFSIAPGRTRQVCFRIENPGLSRSDTLILGGSENVAECPHCFHHRIVINGLSPQPISSVTGSTRPSENLRVRALPNPVYQTLYVEVDLIYRGDVQVELVDLSGRTRLSSVVEKAGPGRHAFPLDCSTLPAGTYLLHTTSGENRRTDIVQVVR